MNPTAVLRYVSKHAGYTCEQLAARLGVDPTLLSTALRILKKEGKLESAGATRGTVWRAIPKQPAKKRATAKKSA